MRGGGNDETVSTGCGPPSVLHILDVTVTYARDSFVDSPAGPFVFSRGGPGILDVTVTYARDSFCGFTGWAFYPLEGGPRYPGTSLTTMTTSAAEKPRNVKKVHYGSRAALYCFVLYKLKLNYRIKIKCQ